jgi:hypothetical protein
MATPCDDVPSLPADETLPETPDRDDIQAHETRNLLTLAIHQIVLRVGWTFKTESIIVPAFLDTVAEAGWLRGCLPLVRNLGQSVPPLLTAETLKRIPLKKWALAAFALLIGVPYLLLAGVWLGMAGEGPAWIAGLFMVLYFGFFVFYGLYQVSFGTVQGKLIRPTRRGQLLWGSTFWGLFPTILFCGWLMPGWLAKPVPGYGYLFLFVGGSFVLSAGIVLLLAEPAGNTSPKPIQPKGNLREALAVLRGDAHLRRLIVLIILSGISLVIIPHYQNFAKTALGLKSQDLVLFVITHTTSVSIYALFIGPVADRWGNRMTLRLLILGAAIAPAYAVALPRLAGGLAPGLFWLVFIPLGLTPIVPTILYNYTLELCEPADHPRYLSIVSLAMMPPYLLSPLVGKLVDWAGFASVAAGTCILMLCCGAMTFWIVEPRRGLPATPGAPSMTRDRDEGS